MALTISSIASSKVQTSWQEPFTSATLNRRDRSRDRGVSRGFVPVPGSGDLILDLEVDQVNSDSTALVGGRGGTQDQYLNVVREDAAVSLDLQAAGLSLGTAYWIGVKVEYSPGSPTTAEYTAYTAADIAASLHETEGAALLCKVTLPGVVQPLADSDIVLMDDDAIRDDQALTRGDTSQGLLRPVAALDGGSFLESFRVLGSNPNVVPDATEFLSGSGSARWTAGAAAEAVDFNPLSQGFFGQTGERVYIEITYKSDPGVIDGALSGFQVFEVDVDGTGLVGPTGILLPDTAGAWVTRRFPLTLTGVSAVTVGGPVLWAFTWGLVSAAAGNVYIDRVVAYNESRNSTIGGIEASNFVSISEEAFAAYRLFNANKLAAPFEVDHSILGTLSLSRAGGGQYDIGEAPNPILVNVEGGIDVQSSGVLRLADTDLVFNDGIGDQVVQNLNGSGEVAFLDGAAADTVVVNANQFTASGKVVSEVLDPVNIGFPIQVQNGAGGPGVMSMTGVILDTISPVGAEVVFGGGADTLRVRSTLGVDEIRGPLGSVAGDEIPVRDETTTQSIGLGATNSPIAWAKLQRNSGPNAWSVAYQYGLDTTFGAGGVGGTSNTLQVQLPVGGYNLNSVSPLPSYLGVINPRTLRSEVTPGPPTLIEVVIVNPTTGVAATINDGEQIVLVVYAERT